MANDTGSGSSSFKCVPGEEPVTSSVPAHITRLFMSPTPVPVFPTWEIALKVLFYVLAMLVDVVGNSLVIFIVSARRKMRTPTNVLLLNLAVADLLVALLCMWVHLGASITPDWPFGLGICKANMFAQVTAVTTSILTLTVISVERFVAIVFPLRRGWTLRFTIPLLGVVWVIACSIAWPQLHVRHLDEVEWADRHFIRCDETWTKVYKNENCDRWMPSKVIYHTFVIVVMFFVPIVVMIVSYTVICVSLMLRKAPGSSTQSDSQARSKKRNKSPHMVTVRYVVLYIAYLNSALNPVLYAGFNENIRRGFQDIFTCGCLPSNKERRVFPVSRQSHSGQSRVGEQKNGAVTTGNNDNRNRLSVPSRHNDRANGKSRSKETQFMQVNTISNARQCGCQRQPRINH
nr:hypothetical protein BaRGS_027681 [Batillaria attramentaria]